MFYKNKYSELIYPIQVTKIEYHKHHWNSKVTVRCVQEGIIDIFYTSL